MSGVQTDILPVLLRLTTILNDGGECFRLAAEDAHSEEIHAFFDRLCRQRLQFAAELTAMAANWGVISLDRITTGADPICGFLDDQTLLLECDRYEKDAVSAYWQALDLEDLPVKVRQVLERHAAEIAESAEKLCRLREGSQPLYHQIL